MLYGAVAASLPDIDFIASFWLKTPDDLMAHRGITHSFCFAIVLIAGLALLFRHRHQRLEIPLKIWLIFMGTEVLSHLFLDGFNAYGVGWLEPFSHHRFAFNTLFVADPFFSFGPGVAAFILLFPGPLRLTRRAWAGWGLFLCGFYLGYSVYNKYNIDNKVRFALSNQQIRYNQYFTTPTPLNTWLWLVVVAVDSGYYTGYRSVFDRTDSIGFTYVPRNEGLLQPFVNQEDTRQLLRFAQGYYSVGQSGHGLVFNVLRFGQMQGWRNPAAPFVFHYYLQDPDANRLVLQRGRFAGWNVESAKWFLLRIRGRE